MTSGLNDNGIGFSLRKVRSDDYPTAPKLWNSLPILLTSEHPQKCHQVLFLVGRQLGPQHKVEELYGIL